MSEPLGPSVLSSWRFLLAAVLLGAVAMGAGWAVGKLRGPQPGATAVDRRGEVLFQVHCASCHGAEGQGDGPSAAGLRPPPRDFADRPWRFEPTAESVRSVIQEGIPGTGMASFRAALTPGELELLVAHVLHLADRRPETSAPDEEGRLLREAGFLDLRGTTLPALTWADAAGKSVSLADLRGRLVLLHFWGTGCVCCRQEMPLLRELETSLAGRGGTVLHVCTDADGAREAQAVADRAVPGLRALVDESGRGLLPFEIQALPAFWLVAPDGTVVGRCEGVRDWTAPAVRALLDHWLPTVP